MAYVAYKQIKPEQVFVRNAIDLTIADLAGGDLESIALKTPTESLILFDKHTRPAFPDKDGTIILHGQDIAEGFQPVKVGLNEEVIFDPNHTLEIRCKEGEATRIQTVKLPWLAGGYDPLYPAVALRLVGIGGYYWLSWRGKSVKTRKWGREWLYLFMHSGEQSQIQRFQVWGEILLKSGRSIKLHLEDLWTLDRDGIRRVDVSYSRIRKAVDDIGLDLEQISQYSVQARAKYYIDDDSRDDCHVTPITFEVAGEDPSELGFIYRSSLGVFETVYASGKSTDRLDFKESTFRRSRTQMTVSNSSLRKVETFSGYLSEETERNRWTELMESEERYVLTPDGKIRAIIIDEASCEMDRMVLQGISFTWHLARERQGYAFDRGDGYPPLPPRPDDSSSRDGSSSDNGSSENWNLIDEGSGERSAIDDSSSNDSSEWDPSEGFDEQELWDEEDYGSSDDWH